MKILYWGIVSAAAVLAVLFAVSNRADIAIALWPLTDRIELPLFLLILVLLLIGFFCGEIAAWVKARRWRRELRERGRRIEALERELAATQARLADAGRPDAPGPAARG